MRLIDGDKLKEKATADPDTGEGIVYVQDIDEAPAVDAVEVVRCKDCKHRKDINIIGGGYSVMHCTLSYGLPCVEPNDFCSYGERKDND